MLTMLSKWGAVVMTAVIAVSVGLLALLVIPMAASAATLKVDVLCSTGPATPLLPFFLAGHAEVNAAGDLMVQLQGVRPSVSWAYGANCLSVDSFTFGRSVLVDNCGVSDQNGMLHAKVPGLFAPILQANDGVCLVPLLSLAPESGLGQFCSNGFGEVE